MAMLLYFLLIALMFTGLGTSELKRFQVPLGDRELLRCSLGADASDIRWSRDGESYGNAATLTSRESVAQLGVATLSLNGSVFECAAVYGEGTAPVTVKRWLIIVEAPPTVLPSLMPCEDGSYAVSWNVSGTSDVASYDLDVPATNFSATDVNATQYKLPASVCPPDPCANCSVFITAENRFGRGDAVELMLRPAIECDADVGNNSTNDGLTRGNSSSGTAVVIDDEFPSNSTIRADNITMKVVLGVVLAVVFGAILITILFLLLVCCSRPRNHRNGVYQMPPDTSSQINTSQDAASQDAASQDAASQDAATTKQASEDDFEREGCIRNRLRGIGGPPKSSTTRDDSFGVVLDQPMTQDPSMQVSVQVQGFLGARNDSYLENGPQEDCCIVYDDDPNLDPSPLCASTPVRNQQVIFKCEGSQEEFEGYSRDALLGNSVSHQKHITHDPDPRQESHQGHLGAGDSSSTCPVFHKVVSASSLFTLEGTVAVDMTKLDSSV